MADWRPFAMQLQKVGEARLPAPPAESQHEINSFLSSELHRNRSSRDELACTPDIAETILESYDRMVEAADTDDEARLRPSFDQARGTVAEATKLFHGLISSERAKQREVAAALAKSNAALDTRAAEISGLDVEVVRLNGEVARLNGEVTAEHDRTVALKADLEAKAAEVVRLSGQVTEWRKQATFVEQELETRRQLLEAVRQSTSWQFTAPFRWISNKSSGLVRRIRRGVHMLAGR